MLIFDQLSKNSIKSPFVSKIPGSLGVCFQKTTNCPENLQMCQGLYSSVLRAKSVYDSPAFWMGFTHDDHIRAGKTNKKKLSFFIGDVAKSASLSAQPSSTRGQISYSYYSYINVALNLTQRTGIDPNHSFDHS